MLSKRKKTLMMQMQKLIKNFPYKDLARCMLDMLNVSESLQKLELEEVNLEEKLSVIENEYNNLIKDTSLSGSSSSGLASPSSDLCTIVTTEYHNLKRLISDYKQKRAVKTEKMTQLNNEYEKLEGNYKRNIEANVENYNKALKEIAQLKDIIYNSNHTMQKSLSSPRNVIIEATLKEGETNRFEINSLDSNILLASDRFSNNNTNHNTIGVRNMDDMMQYNNNNNNNTNKEDKRFTSVDQGMLLTNYDEMEQEMIMKSKGNFNVNTNSSQTKTIKQY